MKTTPAQKREQAAQLVAEARLEYRQITELLGVDAKTLHNWRKDAKFAARVAALSAEFADVAKKRALARKEYRINTLANLHSECLRVIEERAADPKLKNVPGGQTGLVIMQVREIGHGKEKKLLPEYVFDTGILREIRSLQEAAAKELGQHVDRHEMLVPNLKDMNDEQLAKLYVQLTGQQPAGFGDSEATGSEGA